MKEIKEIGGNEEKLEAEEPIHLNLDLLDDPAAISTPDSQNSTPSAKAKQHKQILGAAMQRMHGFPDAQIQSKPR